MSHHFENTYLGELRTESIHLTSGNKIITDAPIDNNGKGQAFSPTDLVSSALASCMMTIMGILAQRNEIDIIGLKAEITKIMAAEPRKIAEIQVKFIFPLNKTYSQEERTKLRNAALTCPVALSLSKDVLQKVDFVFV